LRIQISLAPLSGTDLSFTDFGEVFQVVTFKKPWCTLAIIPLDGEAKVSWENC
jgi:hypothetical protein